MISCHLSCNFDSACEYKQINKSNIKENSLNKNIIKYISSLRIQLLVSEDYLMARIPAIQIITVSLRIIHIKMMNTSDKLVMKKNRMVRIIDPQNRLFSIEEKSNIPSASLRTIGHINIA